MTAIYFQDSRNDLDQWQGLLMSVQTTHKPALILQSGRGCRTKLSVGGQTLFWAEIEDGYSGVNLWRALPRSADVALLPHIDSAQVQAQKHLSPLERRQFWAKWFARGLMESPHTPLAQGLWALEYSDRDDERTYTPHRGLQRHWRNLYDDKRQAAEFFGSPLFYIDWAMCGNGSFIPLFAAPFDLSMDVAESGRVKYWCKVARDMQATDQGGTLPPLLLWFISGLDAFVLLDGHDRLYASLLTGIEPEYLILDSYTERARVLDETRQNAIHKQLNILDQKIAEGTAINPEVILSVQKYLAHSYDDRPVRIERTRASLSLDPEQWQKEVDAYEKQLKSQKPHQALEWFYVDDV